MFYNGQCLKISDVRGFIKLDPYNDNAVEPEPQEPETETKLSNVGTGTRIKSFDSITLDTANAE
jgi:hypothetical protein